MLHFLQEFSGVHRFLIKEVTNIVQLGSENSAYSVTFIMHVSDGEFGLIRSEKHAKINKISFDRYCLENPKVILIP